MAKVESVGADGEQCACLTDIKQFTSLDLLSPIRGDLAFRVRLLDKALKSLITVSLISITDVILYKNLLGPALH